MEEGMKIQSMNGTFGYSPQVREKNDGESAKQDSSHQQEQSNPDESGKKASPERVNEAIESFQTDSLALAHGLSASVEGHGPGLKVVLKDGSGSVVRQFTGEEFLKLREAAAKDVGSRGKILDRKF